MPGGVHRASCQTSTYIRDGRAAPFDTVQKVIHEFIMTRVSLIRCRARTERERERERERESTMGTEVVPYEIMQTLLID